MKARLLFILSIAVLLAGCGNRDIRSRLDMAESYMQTRPDSALAIIRSIDTTSLGTQSLKARYALLHAMALDKNWIDTTDVAVVMPAVDFYDRHKPLTARAKPWYYLGRIQYNGRHYDEAILSFFRAREYAADLRDDRFKALVSQAISDTYSASYLIEEALEYAEEAYRYDLLAADTLLVNSTLFKTAILNNNLKNYSTADSLYNILLKADKINPHTLSSAKAYYAQLSATNQKNYDKAVSLFEQTLSEEKGFDSYNLWGAYAYSLYQTGNQDKCESIFQKLEQAGLKNDYVYRIWKSRIEQQAGNYRVAYDLLEGASQEQMEGVMKILRQSTVKAQRDYLTLQNETLIKENRLRKWINTLMVFSFLASAIAVYVIIRRYRDRVKQKDSNLMEIAQELVEQRQLFQYTVNSLSSEVAATSFRQAQLRQDFFRLSQDSFKALSDLCNAYYKTEGRSSQAHSVCGEVRGLLKNLGIGEDRYPAFEQHVNDQFDQVMTHFRTEHPDHREPFYQTVCYLFAGFKTRTIALLLHLGEQDIYQVKWRLKKEVESTPSPHQNDFLTLLGRPA